MKVKFLKESISIDKKVHKQKQFEIIKNTNPMTDDYHVGIRSVRDIKFPEEVFSQQGWNEDEPGNTEALYPDWNFEDGKKALSKKTITVYSSRKIKNGSFVTPSKMNALDYGSSVNKKTMSIYDIAWITSDEGQVAKVEDYDKIINKSESYDLNEMVKVLDNDRIHKSIDSYLKRVKNVSPHFKSYFNDMFTDDKVILHTPTEASIYLSDGQLGTHCQTRGILIITGVKRSRGTQNWTDFVQVYRASTRLKDGMALFGKLEIKHKDREAENIKVSKQIRQIVRDLAIVIDDNKKLAKRMKELGLSVERWTVKDGIDPGYLKKLPKGYSEMDNEVENLTLEENFSELAREAREKLNKRDELMRNLGLSVNRKPYLLKEGRMKDVEISLHNLNSATSFEEIKSALEDIPVGTEFIRKDGRIVDNIGRVDEIEWILLKAENLNVSSKTIDSLAKWMVSKIGQGKYIFQDEKSKKLTESVSSKNLIKELNKLPLKRGNSKVKYEDVKTFEAILKQFPVGTVISHEIDCGTEKYEKIVDGEYGRWKHFWPIMHDVKELSEFKIADWMAGLGVLSRGQFILIK